MRIRGLTPILILSSMVFISVGDRFLPSPLSDASRTIRESTNNFLIGLMPQGEVKNPHTKNEKVIHEYLQNKDAQKE